MQTTSDEAVAADDADPRGFRDFADSIRLQSVTCHAVDKIMAKRALNRSCAIALTFGEGAEEEHEYGDKIEPIGHTMSENRFPCEPPLSVPDCDR